MRENRLALQLPSAADVQPQRRLPRASPRPCSWLGYRKRGHIAASTSKGDASIDYRPQLQRGDAMAIPFNQTSQG
jgi:hypothetical protein